MNGAVKVYHAYRKTNITPISKYAFEKSLGVSLREA
jgi:hypothetical protein